MKNTKGAKSKNITTWESFKNGKYIPDQENFEYYVDYALSNPGEKRTYEGYLAFKMKKMLEKEGEKKCQKQS